MSNIPPDVHATFVIRLRLCRHDYVQKEKDKICAFGFEYNDKKGLEPDDGRFEVDMRSILQEGCGCARALLDSTISAASYAFFFLRNLLYLITLSRK